MKQILRPAAVLAFVLLAVPAFADTQPDAGQTLQQFEQPPPLPKPAPAIPLQPPPGRKAEPGGPKVTLQSVAINGNTAVSDVILQSLLSDAIGKAFDLAGLNGLTDRIDRYYRGHDYPFARAFIPPQTVADGRLRIEVVEGRYGKISVKGKTGREDQAQSFADDALKPGTVIRGSDMERTALILDDLPGYRFTPIIRPGAAAGEGDLVFGMEREDRFGGSIQADNYGNRYTGAYRGLLDLHADSPFMLGDQVTLSGVYTNENLWLGGAGYSLPIGASGLRGALNYVHTYYELGKRYADLDIHGTADVASAGLRYPLIRSQDANLALLVDYQHKWLTDRQDSDDFVGHKQSDSVPITLTFDRRDDLMGGAITYGAFALTNGTLHLDHGLRDDDRHDGHTDGYFFHADLDVARLQATPVEHLFLFARAAGQAAANNLDSSEEFGLGGPDGVRAFPTGEAYGDSGWLAQIEIRYAIDAFTPYVFYDHGGSWTDADPWQSGDNYRSIGGGGLGLRAQWNGLHADVSAAWRGAGGKPQSDSHDAEPLVWASIGYDF